MAVQAEPRRRLPPEIFELPVEKLREKVGRSFRPNPRLERVE